MEYCDGGALVDRLKNSNRPLLLTTMINYAEQIVDGMCYLASQKVVHRDLAARNILLTKGEKVHITLGLPDCNAEIWQPYITRQFFAKIGGNSNF
jgi:serine/threonine protein kinase